MVKVKLEPTFEEMEKAGKGTIPIVVNLFSGKLGENTVQVKYNNKFIFMNFRGRNARISIEEMILEANALIDKDIKLKEERKKWLEILRKCDSLKEKIE